MDKRNNRRAVQANRVKKTVSQFPRVTDGQLADGKGVAGAFTGSVPMPMKFTACVPPALLERPHGHGGSGGAERRT